MNPTEAIEQMIEESGKTSTEISVGMGRSREYLRSTMRNSRNPSLLTMAAIADACGYDAELVNESTGEVIRLK